MVHLFVDDPAIGDIQEMLKKYPHRSIMLAALELVDRKQNTMTNTLWQNATELRKRLSKFIEDYYST